MTLFEGSSWVKKANNNKKKVLASEEVPGEKPKVTSDLMLDSP